MQGEQPGPTILTRADFENKQKDPEEESIPLVEYHLVRLQNMVRSDMDMLALLNGRAAAGWRLVTVVDGDLAIFAKERPIV